MRRFFTLLAIVVTLTGGSAALWGQAPTVPSLPIINVRDYGARGDGQSDDYAAFQLAISLLNAAGTGTLYIPPGTYKIDRYKGNPLDPKVDDLVIRNGSNITVTGYGATLLIKGDFTRDSAYVNSIQLVFSRCRQFVLQGLTMNGHVDLMTRDPADRGEGPCSGIVTSVCSDYLIRDVYVHHFANDGIYLGSSKTTADRNATLMNVRCASNARQGLTILQLRHGRFIGCVFEGTGRTNTLGAAPGPYGVHLPTAGVDIEPDAAPPQMDVLTGDIVFRNCSFRNNLGSQFQAGQNTLSEDVALWDCDVEKGNSTNPSTVLLTVPNGLLAGCNLNVDTLYVTRWDGQTNVRTTVWKCRIQSDTGGIAKETPDGAAIIEGNTITSTRQAPLSAPLVDLSGPQSIFRNNVVFVPDSAKTSDQGTLAAAVRGCALSSGNVFRTDYAGPGYFYTDYAQTPVQSDLYASGAWFRPGASSTWDTSVPFDQGQPAEGLPPAVGDVNGDGQVTMADVPRLVAVNAGLEPASALASGSWFASAAGDIADAIRLTTYVKWLGQR